MMLLKIGELAQRTGLTVRTLHHYHKIGLLSPSGRNQAGYRLYNRHDLTRLHRILTLKRLNLSLDEIASLIDQDQASLAQVISQQILLLEQQIQQAQDLRERLHTLAQLMARDDDEHLDYWLMRLEKMSVMDKYFARDEMALLKQKNLDQVQRDEAELKQLIVKIRSCYEQALAPEDQIVQELAQQWVSALNQALPDPGMLRKFVVMHQSEEALHSLSGVDAVLENYLQQAWVARRYNLYRAFFSEAELVNFKQHAMQYNSEWMQIFADLRELKRQGQPAEGAAVQQVIQRWRELSMVMWGHQPELVQRARQAHLQEPRLNQGGGLTPDLLNFARQGMRFLEQQLAQQASDRGY